MFGENPKRGVVKGDGDLLFIQNIFFTFQGEGPFSGYPSIFIRLGGCNLACKFCDTEFESFQEMKLEEILAKVTELAEGRKLLAVITGGEPFRQNIEKLCTSLLTAGFMVQIETNGTLWRNIDERVDIICSPKNTGRGYQPITSMPPGRISAFKFLISNSNKDYDHVPEIEQSSFNIPVYVQPMDEYNPAKNKDNLLLTLELARKFGYRISLQLHKVIGID